VKTLLTETEIQAGVARLAKQISATYPHRPLTIVGVLTGSLVLLADLIRQLDRPLQLGLILASSYRGAATSPGQLVVHSQLLPEIEGHEVLVVDDIFDTGRTLQEVRAQLKDLKPASLRSAVLLRKAERCEVNLQPDFVAFDIPDRFVVGYGLDYNDQYRNLPYLAVLDQEELA